MLRREEGEFSYVLYLKDYDDNELEDMWFPLGSQSAFRRAVTQDDPALPCFTWRDPRFGDNDKVEYEFAWSDKNSDATAQFFHLTLAQCLYETINKKVVDGATETEIKALMVTEGIEPEAEKKNEYSIDGRIIYQSEQAGFYVFDSATNMFVPRNDPVLAFISEPGADGSKKKKSSFEYKLSVVDVATRAIVHQQAIDPDATLHTDRASGSFIWCHYTKDNLVWTYSLRFSSPASLMGYSNAIGQAIYETLNKESFTKVDEEEARYVLNPFLEDVEMASPEDDDETEEESEAEDGIKDEFVSHGSKSEKNAQLAVGYKHDRSFVSRGHTIGVFKHNEDKLTLATSIDKVKTTTGKLFTPSKMMLHEEDSSLLLMNPDDKHKIFKMDLERGSVVEEWNVHPDAVVNEIVPDSKYAQMTSTKTLIGLNENSIFRIDPRLAGNKRVDNEMKQYVVKNKFTSGATTGKGELAVASAKGEIRLFDKLDKRAKTLLPGFGDPILGIDVTESGKLIVATCKNYLLLIDTEIEHGIQGFTKSMGAEKPAPKRLQLKPEHIAFMGSAVNFTPARFSTGSSEERSIITSTGPYVITWNLRRVKQGKLSEYQIKKYEDTVVADNFRFGQDRNIVVTLPDNVTMISAKSLATPTPSLFGKGKNKNNIVDSPY